MIPSLWFQDKPASRDFLKDVQHRQSFRWSRHGFHSEECDSPHRQPFDSVLMPSGEFLPGLRRTQFIGQGRVPASDPRSNAARDQTRLAASHVNSNFGNFGCWNMKWVSLIQKFVIREESKFFWQISVQMSIFMKNPQIFGQHLKTCHYLTIV